MPATAVVSDRLSSKSLILSSTAANPMIVGEKVAPRPFAWALNSCHQLKLTPVATASRRSQLDLWRQGRTVRHDVPRHGTLLRAA